MKKISHGGNIYKKAKEMGIREEDILDFSANISPLGLPEHIRQAMVKAIDQTINYPDPDCSRLKEAISKEDAVSETKIACGNGGADLLYRLAFGLQPKKAGKSSDGAEMFDASDEIYDHILCSICPVKLSKAGLHYNAETNNIEDRIRDWLVEMPDWGFLFPQFNDRSTDIHGMLYYTKNAEELRSTMMDEVFGCTTPLSAGNQRDSFNALVEETLGDDCAYDTVLEIHEKLNDLIESQKDEPEPVVLTKSEVKRLFEECGVEDEKLQNFDEQYELAAGEKSALVASNITNTRKFEIKTPDVVIHVAPDRAELVETRIIDGRKCLVIPMESEIELNGIRVSTLNSVEDTSAEPLPVNDITDIDNSNTEEEIPF